MFSVTPWQSSFVRFVEAHSAFVVERVRLCVSVSLWPEAVAGQSVSGDSTSGGFCVFSRRCCSSSSSKMMLGAMTVTASTLVAR